MQTTFSTSFNKPTGCGNVLNPIQTIEKFARKWAQIFLISHITVTLNGGQGHPNWYQDIQFRVSIIIPSLKEIAV